jgi:hypothetical protein
MQLSKIECRQRRIRAIRERLMRCPTHQTNLEDVVTDTRVHYNIGKTQNSPVHVPTFLWKNDGDPAIKVASFTLFICHHCVLKSTPIQNFFQKLRKHLLPRIQEELGREAVTFPDRSSVGTVLSDNELHNFVFLKNDRIYHHNLTRFHFTTYDVRRGTDIINPGTSRCNIMLLADEADCSSNSHHFLYARVLGVYHANVIYTGPGMRGYEARRLDFLWVRWYDLVDPASSGWSTSRLDSVRFLPTNRDDAFGFVDPKDVLRGCHIMPNIQKEKRYANGVGVSRCAKDGKDYNCYYVGR